MIKKYLLFVCIILLCRQAYAQATLTIVWASSGKFAGMIQPLITTNNYLVTHAEIRQKVLAGSFTQRAQTTIPNDNLCVTVQEAKSWLYLDESVLPTNGRLPVWQELVATAPTCSMDERWINGACERYVSVSCCGSASIGSRWYNTYCYLWSDGSTEERSVTEDQPCPIE